MVDKKEVIKEKVDNTGIFNFRDFYGLAYNWLKERENYGVIEDKYSESLSGNSKTIEIVWKATKDLSDYFKIEIEVKMKVSNLTDVEVEIDGKTKRTNRGNINVEIKGILVRDAESRWDVAPFYRFLRDVYDKYVIPHRIKDFEQKVITDIIIFKEELKAFFEIEGKR